MWRKFIDEPSKYVEILHRNLGHDKRAIVEQLRKAAVDSKVIKAYQDHVKTCTECNTHARAPNVSHGSIRMPRRFLENVAFDIVHIKDLDAYVLHLVDEATSYSWSISCDGPATTSDDFIKLLIEWHSSVGKWPDSLNGDRQTSMISKETQTWARNTLGYEIGGYAPHNKIAESHHRALKRHARDLISELSAPGLEPDSAIIVPMACNRKNNHPLAAGDYTPHQLRYTTYTQPNILVEHCLRRHRERILRMLNSNAAHSGAHWSITAGMQVRFYEEDRGWSGNGVVTSADPSSTQLTILYNNGRKAGSKRIHRTWCIPVTEVHPEIVESLHPPPVHGDEPAEADDPPDIVGAPNHPDRPAHAVPMDPAPFPVIGEPSIYNAFHSRSGVFVEGDTFDRFVNSSWYIAGHPPATYKYDLHHIILVGVARTQAELDAISTRLTEMCNPGPGGHTRYGARCVSVSRDKDIVSRSWQVGHVEAATRITDDVDFSPGTIAFVTINTSCSPCRSSITGKNKTAPHLHCSRAQLRRHRDGHVTNHRFSKFWDDFCIQHPFTMPAADGLYDAGRNQRRRPHVLPPKSRSRNSDNALPAPAPAPVPAAPAAPDPPLPPPPPSSADSLDVPATGNADQVSGNGEPPAAPSNEEQHQGPRNREIPETHSPGQTNEEPPLVMPQGAPGTFDENRLFKARDDEAWKFGGRALTISSKPLTVPRSPRLGSRRSDPVPHFNMATPESQQESPLIDIDGHVTAAGSRHHEDAPRPPSQFARDRDLFGMNDKSLRNELTKRGIPQFPRGTHNSASKSRQLCIAHNIAERDPTPREAGPPKPVQERAASSLFPTSYGSKRSRARRSDATPDLPAAKQSKVVPRYTRSGLQFGSFVDGIKPQDNVNTERPPPSARLHSGSGRPSAPSGATNIDAVHTSAHPHVQSSVDPRDPLSPYQIAAVYESQSYEDAYLLDFMYGDPHNAYDRASNARHYPYFSEKHCSSPITPMHSDDMETNFLAMLIFDETAHVLLETDEETGATSIPVSGKFAARHNDLYSIARKNEFAKFHKKYRVRSRRKGDYVLPSFFAYTLKKTSTRAPDGSYALSKDVPLDSIPEDDNPDLDQQVPLYSGKSAAPYLRQPRARWCVCGDREDPTMWFPSDSPVVTRTGVRLLSTIAVQQGWVLNSWDVKGAYLEVAPPRQGLCVKPPPELISDNGWPEDSILELLSAQYGIRDSGRAWYWGARGFLSSIDGCYSTSSDPCLFAYHHPSNTSGIPNGVLGLNVDDTLWAGDELFKTHVMDAFAKRFPIGTEDQGKFTFCGLDFDQNARTKEVDITMHGYIKQMSNAHRVSDSATEGIRTLNRKADDPLSPEEIQYFRQPLGETMWVVSQLAAHYAYDVSDVAQRMSKPTVADVARLQTVINALRADPPTHRIEKLPGGLKDCSFMVWNDASLAKSEKMFSQLGMISALVTRPPESFSDKETPHRMMTHWENEPEHIRGCLISWLSRRSPRVVSSSFGAETLGATRGFAEAQYLATFMWEIAPATAHLPQVRCDGNSFIESALKTTGKVSEPNLAADLQQIRQLCTNAYHSWETEYPEFSRCQAKFPPWRPRGSSCVGLRWGPADSMIADALTKCDESTRPMLRSALSGFFKLPPVLTRREFDAMNKHAKTFGLSADPSQRPHVDEFKPISFVEELDTVLAERELLRLGF